MSSGSIVFVQLRRRTGRPRPVRAIRAKHWVNERFQRAVAAASRPHRKHLTASKATDFGSVWSTYPYLAVHPACGYPAGSLTV